jgi:hypothetical protein
MKALLRLALTLTVAVVASLAPVAFADSVVDPLDNNAGPWQSSDGGTCRFYYGGQKFSLLYGQYTIYTATHTHADGYQMEMEAIYWQHPSYQGLVTFTWRHGADRGTGQWILGPGLNALTGTWKSTIGNASGTWSLWR